MSTPEHDVALTRSDDGQVGWLHFRSTHKANVMTHEMLLDLLARVEEVEGDEGLRVLVVSGREEIFSGGADLEAIRALSDDAYKAYIATEYDLFRRIERLPLITLAVLAGPCIGNATELALACDFRIAAPDVRIGLPELRVGFVAPAQRISQYVGVGVAKELLYLGRLLDVESARAHGLITDVAEGELFAAARKSAERYARIAPYALRRTKAGLVRTYEPDDFDAQELQAAYETFKSDDFAEGADAVLGGRKPAFQGR